jgi:hypothetical protein
MQTGGVFLPCDWLFPVEIPGKETEKKTLPPRNLGGVRKECGGRVRGRKPAQPSIP